MQAKEDEWGYSADQEAIGDGVEEGFFEKALGALRIGVSKGLEDSWDRDLQLRRIVRSSSRYVRVIGRSIGVLGRF